MGYIPPLLPVTLTDSERAELKRQRADAYNGPSKGKMVILPEGMTMKPLDDAFVNCRGCGANHLEAEKCPYCGARG